jgi:hypothetical protein
MWDANNCGKLTQKLGAAKGKLPFGKSGTMRILR